MTYRPWLQTPQSSPGSGSVMMGPVVEAYCQILKDRLSQAGQVLSQVLDLTDQNLTRPLSLARLVHSNPLVH